MSKNKDVEIYVDIPINDSSSFKHLPASIFWDVYEAIIKADTDGANAIAQMVGFVLKTKPLEHVEIDVLSDVIHGIKQSGDQWENREHYALWITYEALRNRKIDHERAAKIASKILPKYYSKEAWRVKLLRWAEKEKLPPVGIRKQKTK